MHGLCEFCYSPMYYDILTLSILIFREFCIFTYVSRMDSCFAFFSILDSARSRITSIPKEKPDFDRKFKWLHGLLAGKGGVLSTDDAWLILY